MIDCVACDLDGTLVGHWTRPDGQLEVALRPEAEEWLGKIRASSKRMVLWTFGNRQWYTSMAALFPILKIFDAVVTRDDLDPHVTVSGGRREPIKDVRVLGVDLLVDNEPAHLRWAERHGLADRYLLVPTFGEG